LENEYGEKDKIINSYKQLTEKVQELQKLDLTKEKERTPEEKEQYKTYLAEITKINNEIQNAQNYRDNLSSHTADSYAREKSIEWWILNLSYQDNDGNLEPLFTGNNYEEKYQKLIEIEESDDVFLNDVMAKFASLVSFFYLYPDLATKEKFDLVLKMHDEDRKMQSDALAEENKVEEKTEEKVEEAKKVEEVTKEKKE